jgi:type IV pilus assembly protein PilW
MTPVHARGRRKRASGFTIIEFLVAMTIGLIVSLAIGQIFLGVRQSFSSQEDSSRIQENMRFASQALSRALRQAGFRNNPAVAASQVFPRATLAAIEGADNASTITLAGGGNGTKPTVPTNAAVTPDTVTVRFQGSGSGTAADGTIVDCLGNSIDYGQMARNTFAVRAVTKPDGTASSSLFCSTDGTWPANNELIPDVDNMQILYGVDTNNDGAADKYVRYGDIGTVAANIDQVVAVRIWLLLRSATPTQTRSESATYTLAGVNFIYNDRFQRRVLYMTVNLRNRTL